MHALLGAWLLGIGVACAGARAHGPIEISPQWSDIVGVSRASATIEVCVEPPLRRAHPIHDQLFAALKSLGADYAHYQPYSMFPRLAIVEPLPPARGRTFWDFSLLDPITADFMDATQGHSVVFNIGTLPAWMFATKAPAELPHDPDAIDWNYSEFNSLGVTEESIRKAAEYQARVAAWYTQGGFTDEYGRWRPSGHHYKVDYWDVLNDPDFEGALSPQDYTRLYDAIVSAVKKAVPGMKFMGPSLADVSHAAFFDYFLDPAHHKPDVPIDMLSYHMFILPDSDESEEVMSYTFFQQADRMLLAAQYIESLRQRLQPQAHTDVADVATMLPDPLAPRLTRPIPRSYWSLSGGLFAYLYGRLALLGVDAVGASELIDFPGMVAASTLVDWETGQPTARYWVLQLLRQSLGPGDRLVRPPDYNVLQPDPSPQLYWQAFISRGGKRRLLVVNKRNAPLAIRIPGAVGGVVQVVEETTNSSPTERRVADADLQLPEFAVAIVTFP